MTRFPITLTMAWASLVLPGASTVFAQSSQQPAPPPSLTINAGASASSRLDATASPRVFGGVGPNASLQLTYPLANGRYLLDASAGGGIRNASPRGATDAASQRTMNIETRGTLLRQWSPSRSASTFGLGLTASANLDFTQHRYADPTMRTSDFRMSTVALAPTIAWASPLRGGLASVQLSSPVLGIVSHPYSDVRGASLLGGMQLETLAKLRGANAQVAYTTALHGLGVSYFYRFGYLDYADAQRFRSMSHGFGIGLTRNLSPRSTTR